MPARFYSPILFTFGVQPIKNLTITDEEVHAQWARAQLPAHTTDRASVVQINDREEALLRDVATIPISPITHRYHRLGWHMEMGNRTKDAIIKRGLARFDAVSTLKGQVKILTLTPDGIAVLASRGGLTQDDASWWCRA